MGEMKYKPMHSNNSISNWGSIFEGKVQRAVQRLTLGVMGSDLAWGEGIPDVR